MKIARPYQIEAAEALFQAVKDPKTHPIAAIPTGAGKTVVICEFIDSYLTEHSYDNVLILSHVQEILDQDYDALREHFDGMRIGLYSAGLDSRTIEKITVAGIQSVYKRAEQFKQFGVVIIDECHLVNARESGMYRSFLNDIEANYVGLTATHFRTGHGYIHIGREALFNKLAYNICDIKGFNHLIDNNWLSPLIAKGTGMKLNTAGLGIRMHDYIPKEMSKRFDRKHITEKAVEEIVKIGEPYKKWLVFAIDIDHAINIAEEINKHGIPTGYLHSKMDEDRDNELIKFKIGKYRCMVNVNMMTTGLDIPEIDLIAHLRPTQSPVLHVQSLGRGMRVSPGKTHCLVLDFAGNVRRLGPINDITIDQVLHGGAGVGGLKVKECPECQGLIPIQSKECEYCGYKYPVREKIQTKAFEGEIILKEKPKPSKDWLEITSVKYHPHSRAGRPMMMKVSYLCGFTSFHEYVCFDHAVKSYAKHKANNWVRFRLVPGANMPYNCSDLLRYTNQGKIRIPKKIQVILGGRYPSIEDMTF
jgi:DNA repair protein RadD